MRKISKTITTRGRNNEKSISRASCVLLTTGSFNPIHRSHISNLTIVRNYLENHPKRPLNVLAAFLSPSQYVPESLLNLRFISILFLLVIRMCARS